MWLTHVTLDNSNSHRRASLANRSWTRDLPGRSLVENFVEKRGGGSAMEDQQESAFGTPCLRGLPRGLYSSIRSLRRPFIFGRGISSTTVRDRHAFVGGSKCPRRVQSRPRPSSRRMRWRRRSTPREFFRRRFKDGRLE